MNPTALGHRIREQRKEHRMTSEQLAELCDVGSVHIRKIESGAKIPSLNLFVKLCNSLHTSPQFLLQDYLEPNELTKQLQMIDRINQLSKSDIIAMLSRYLQE